MPKCNFEKAQGEPCLIILDDLLTEVYSEGVCVLFTRSSHHRNIGVILITQKLFHQGPNCRDIALNAKYLVLFRNVRDKRQFYHLANQVPPKTVPDCLRRIMTQLRAYGYLLFDYHRILNTGTSFEPTTSRMNIPLSSMLR